MESDILKFDYSQLTQFFKIIRKIDPPELSNKRKNIFEITGYPHLENVLSNIFAFYFDKNAEHNFSDLFLSALLEIINIKTAKSINFIDWEIEREYVTKNGNRIDILIKSISTNSNDSYVIVIENKIYAGQNNPFAEYLDNFSDISVNNRIGVLLTIFPEENDLFTNITHKQFLDCVLKNLNAYFLETDDRHLLYLKDLYQNILNLTEIKEMKELIKFYCENSNKFEEIKNIRKSIINHFCETIKNIDFNLTGNASFSGNREEIWQYIDNNKNSWIKFINSNIFNENKLRIEIGFYAKRIKMIEIINNQEIKNLIGNNAISENPFKPIENFVWLFKDYNTLNHDNLINYSDYIRVIYENDWNDINQLIIKNIEVIIKQ